MKTVDFRDNKIGFKKSAERLRHLWHLDDPDWLQTRKEQAEVLAKSGFSRNSAKDNRTYMRFFVSGEYTDYVDDTSVMLLTPYDSKEAARLVFESGLFLPSGREKLLRRFAFSAHSLGEGMPWLRDHLKHFSEGVMGSNYEVIEEVENNRRSRTISPDPSYWCRTFLSATRKNLTERRGYRGYEFFLPYFVSALPHVTDIQNRQRCRIDDYLSLIDRIMSSDDAPGYAREFAAAFNEHDQEIRANWALNSELD